MEVFETALERIMPALELKQRRVGGANYQVPGTFCRKKINIRFKMVSKLCSLCNEKLWNYV